MLQGWRGWGGVSVKRSQPVFHRRKERRQPEMLDNLCATQPLLCQLLPLIHSLLEWFFQSLQHREGEAGRRALLFHRRWGSKDSWRTVCPGTAGICKRAGIFQPMVRLAAGGAKFRMKPWYSTILLVNMPPHLRNNLVMELPASLLPFPVDILVKALCTSLNLDLGLVYIKVTGM